MTDRTPTNPSDRSEQQVPADWGAAPTPTSTATLDAPTPPAAPAWSSWHQGQPNGGTPWYGAAATERRRPKPPWFWPVIAAAVGLAALLAGGGIGFAIGHAIGGSSQSTTQVPGTGGGGTNRFPGGGTGQFPGNGTQGGSGTGTGSDGTGSDTSGSTSNS